MAIIGGAVGGGAVFVILIVVIAIFLMRRRKKPPKAQPGKYKILYIFYSLYIIGCILTSCINRSLRTSTHSAVF